SLSGRQLERPLSVLGLDHLIAGVRQQITKDLTIVFLILDNKNAFFHVCPVRCSTCIGTVNENVAPSPIADSTHNRPPCISIIRFAMARPNPVPPFFLVAELSAC